MATRVRAGAFSQLLLTGLLLTGCTTGSSVKLFSGEAGRATGGVAVLDPVTGEDRGMIDQANSKAKVRGGRARIGRFEEAALSPADRQLMNFLPPPPRIFVFSFDPGAARPTAASMAQLSAIRAEMDKRPGVEVNIVGHTDSTSGPQYNYQLSLDRAEAMKAILASEGQIPEASMTTAGRGEDDPLPGHEGDNREDWANRRVEVVIR